MRRQRGSGDGCLFFFIVALFIAAIMFAPSCEKADLERRANLSERNAEYRLNREKKARLEHQIKLLDVEADRLEKLDQIEGPK